MRFMCGARAAFPRGSSCTSKGMPPSRWPGAPHPGQEAGPLHLHRHAAQLQTIVPDRRPGAAGWGTAQLVLAVVELILVGLDHRPGIPDAPFGLRDAVPLQVAVHPPPGRVAHIARRSTDRRRPARRPSAGSGAGRDPGTRCRSSPPGGKGFRPGRRAPWRSTSASSPRGRGRRSACPGTGLQVVGLVRWPGRRPLVPRGQLVHRLQRPPPGVLLPLHPWTRPGRPGSGREVGGERLVVRGRGQAGWSFSMRCPSAGVVVGQDGLVDVPVLGSPQTWTRTVYVPERLGAPGLRRRGGRRRLPARGAQLAPAPGRAPLAASAAPRPAPSAPALLRIPHVHPPLRAEQTPSRGTTTG